MAAKTAVTIRVGRSSGKFDAKDSRASTFFVDSLAQEGVALERRNNLVAVKALKDRLSREVEAELVQAVRYAEKYMVGQNSSRGIGTEKTFTFQQDSGRDQLPNYFLSSRQANQNIKAPQFKGGNNSFKWANLAPSTRRRKRKTNPDNAEKFFLHTGALRQQLRAAARSIVQGTGVMSFSVLEQGKSVRVTAQTTHIPLAKLRITFLPKVFRGDLPGLASGNLGDFNPAMGFEKRVGVAGEMLEKLRGKAAGGNTRPEWHRPLLQPVFTFWTLFKLPRRVARVMADIVQAPSTRGRP